VGGGHDLKIDRGKAVVVLLSIALLLVAVGFVLLAGQTEADCTASGGRYVQNGTTLIIMPAGKVFIPVEVPNMVCEH
jgi:hypothetical protein